MSKVTEPRRWTAIWDYEEEGSGFRATLLPEGDVFLRGKEEVEVIEASAYNALKAENEKMRAALEFYASTNAWFAEGIKGLGLQSKRRSIMESDVDSCGGKRAREALAETSEVRDE